MSPDFQERRRAPRFDVFFAMPTLKSIYRVDGRKVKLINMSRRGALISSHEKMAQGSSIVLRAVTAETVYMIKGRIARCDSSPGSDQMFQAGIEFDKEFTFLPVSVELLSLFKDDEEFLQ